LVITSKFFSLRIRILLLHDPQINLLRQELRVLAVATNLDVTLFLGELSGRDGPGKRERKMGGRKRRS